MKKTTIIALVALLCSFGHHTVYGQLGALKDKAKAVAKPDPKPEPKQEVKPAPSSQPAAAPAAASASAAVAKASIEDAVAAEQKKIESEGTANKLDNTTGEFGGTLSSIGKAYLTFLGDYGPASPAKSVFSGKDFIYAKAVFPAPVSSYLPTDEDYNLEYYRVNLKIEANGQQAENSVKLQRKTDFKLGYSDKEVLLAVVPEKGFFEAIAEGYKTDGNFPSATKETEAYSDVLGRNFSRQVSGLFKELPVGKHRVDVQWEVTAKMKGSGFVQLKDIKGVFVIDINEESKQRYSEVFDLLTGLYKEYEDKRSIASQTVGAEAEAQMLENMTPRERERYQIAKRSPFGYMAAYGGEKFALYFSFGSLREKNAYLDVIWNDGPCDKCEAGTSSFMVTKATPRTVEIPKGAKVSINGRVLVPQVSEKTNVVLYWYY